MDAFVEASVEVTSTDIFRGSSHGSYFHGRVRENSTEVPSTEISTEALVVVKFASTEAFTDAFVEVNLLPRKLPRKYTIQ